MGRCLDQGGQVLVCHSIDGLVSVDPHPCDGVTAWGHLKNHHVFPLPMAVVHLAPDLGDLISVGDVDGIVATVGIELAPGCGLNCEGRHVVLFVVCILVGQRINRGR